MEFRTTIRRKVTRRSGFNASGETTGSEVKITNAIRFKSDSSKAEFKFLRKNVIMVPLFNKNFGMVAFSTYLYPNKPTSVTVKLSGIYNGQLYNWTTSKTIEEGRWNRIGLHGNIEITNELREVSEITCFLGIRSQSGVDLNIISTELNAVNYDYYIDNDEAGMRFHQKTYATIPEIYYFDPEVKLEEILVKHTPGTFSTGISVVRKSCNRCTRYLPINAVEERNKVSFSNHCVKNAPCTHSAFSKYRIVEKTPRIDEAISQKIKNEYMHMYHGYQLECVACKKYYVNSALNKLRTPTQHREDSLRRRAFEVLTDTLLGNKWIYFDFREKTGKEFDKYIWEKFNRKCFNCGIDIPFDDFHLDHTMPLAYLWPLDIHATCLCSTCNGKKSDSFPVDFYSSEKINELIKITGIDETLVKSRAVNEVALNRLKEEVVWFFDTFLMNEEYQKIRDGKKAADLILLSLTKVISSSENKFNLIEEYYKKTGRLPTSVTLKKAPK